jgi:FkbM family methyltransferase
MSKLTQSLKKRWRIMTDRDFRLFRTRIRNFKRSHGNETPAGFDNITATSVVFDLGGYEGDWADNMRARYDCTFHVFEPHPTFSANLSVRFKDDPKVHCHDFAVGQSDGVLQLSDGGDGSSAFVTGGDQVTGAIRDVRKVWRELNLRQVAATKINIEGGEYNILPALIDSELIANFDQLVIQFHDYGAGQVEQRDIIRNELAKTHACDWNYDFVWEKWRLV